MLQVALLKRRFVGLFSGQDGFLQAEKQRRGESLGVIAREVIDFGILVYKKKHNLPAMYPSNGLKK